MSGPADPTPTGQMPPVFPPSPPRRGLTFTLRPVHAVVAAVVILIAAVILIVVVFTRGGGTAKYASSYPSDITTLLSRGMPTATRSQVSCVAHWLESNVSYGELQSQTQAGLGAFTTALHSACGIPLSTLLEPANTGTAPATTTPAARTPTTLAAPATTAPATTAPATTPTAGGQISLVAGPYGFLIPEGWQESPLTNGGGPASFASFSSPPSGATIKYVISAGESGEVYTQAGTPNPEGVIDAGGCSVISSSMISSNELAVSCSSTVTGMATNGVIIVAPVPPYLNPNYSYTWKGLWVTLPVADQATATTILNSFGP